MVRPLFFVTVLSLLSLSSGPALRAQVAAPVEPAPTATAPLRIGILGASVSDGFGCQLREPRADGVYGGSFRMATMLPLVCGDRPIAVVDEASSGMFAGAVRIGGEAAGAVHKAQPQCVVALDFLFWYCYGPHGRKHPPEQAEAERLAVFEKGLGELAKFEVPVVVGDIPDMSRAVGKMLRASQMPPLESIAAANTRLAAWAKEHPNVRVLPLSKMIRQLHEEKVVEVAGKRFAATAEQPLLQADDLHATAAGLAAITCVLVDELAQAEPKLGLPRATDPAAVIQRAKAGLTRTEARPGRSKPADAGK